jgi:hypothetical protein
MLDSTVKNNKFPLSPTPHSCPSSLNIQQFADMVEWKRARKLGRNNSIKANIYKPNEYISSMLEAVKFARILLLIYCYTF